MDRPSLRGLRSPKSTSLPKISTSTSITDVKLASRDQEISDQKKAIRDLNQIINTQNKTIVYEQTISKNLKGSNASLNGRNLKLQREFEKLKVRYDADWTTDLQHQLRDKDGQNKNLQADLDKTQGLLSSAMTELNTLKETETQGNQLRKHEAEREGWRNTKATLKSLDTELQEDLEDAWKAAARKAAARKAAARKSALHAEEIQTKLSDAEELKKSLYKEIAELKAANEGLADTLSSRDQTIDTMQGELRKAKQDLTAADNKAKSYFGTFGRLHTQITSVNDKKNNLKDQVGKLEEKLDDLPLSCWNRRCNLYGKSQQVDSSSVHADLQETKKELKTTKELLEKSEVAKASLRTWLAKDNLQINALRKDKQTVKGKKAEAEKRAGKLKNKLKKKYSTRKAIGGSGEKKKKKTRGKAVSGKRKRKSGDEEEDAGPVKRSRRGKTGNKAAHGEDGDYQE